MKKDLLIISVKKNIREIILTLLDCVFGIMLRVTKTIRAIHPLEKKKKKKKFSKFFTNKFKYLFFITFKRIPLLCSTHFVSLREKVKT